MSAVIKTAKVSQVPRALDRLIPRQKAPAQAASDPVQAIDAAVPLKKTADDGERFAQAAAHEIEAELQRADLLRRQQAAEKLGYDEGQTMALAQADKQRQDERKRVAALLEGLDVEIARYKSRLEDGLVEVVFEALVRILGNSLAGAEGVAAMVRHVIEEHAAEQDEITVRLSPADLLVLGEDGCESVRAGLRTAVRFEPDSKLAAGGCLIDMPSGTLDARLELRLERLKNSLLEARKSAR